MILHQFLLDQVAVAYVIDDGIALVCSDISFSIEPGELVAIVGKNGSGKSTLARVLAGLLPISRGTMIKSPEALHSTQIIMQNPDAQIIGDTVYEDICFGLENHCIASADMPIRARKALSTVGLLPFMHVQVDKLSGGQKQLLCIASALAIDADVLIFDESTAMLDPRSRIEIIEVIQSLHKEGRTVLWVTQLLEEIGHFQRVIALHEGKISFDGTPSAFFYQLDDDDETPCEKLQLIPPYPVLVVNELHRAGMMLEEQPVLMSQLKEVIIKQCLSI